MKKVIFCLLSITMLACNKQTVENISADMLIKNITIIDGTGNSESYNQNIYIKEGRIIKIDTITSYTSADTIIDGAGKYLIPGLFDNHYHFTRDSLNITRNLEQLIHFGVTNVFIPGSSLAPYPTLQFYDSLEKKNHITAPKMWYTSPSVTIENAHPVKSFPGPIWVEGENVYFLRDGSTIPKIIEDARTNGAMGIKIIIEDGPAPPFIERIDADLIRKVADEAHANDLLLVSHVSDMEEVRMSVENGVDAIMHFASIDWSNDLDLLLKIKEKNISWVTTLNMGYGFIDYPLHPEWIDSEKWDVFDVERLELKAQQDQAKQVAIGIIKGHFNMEPENWNKHIPQSYTDVNKLDSLGINIVLGTDVGTPQYNVSGLSVHEEMQHYQKGGMNSLRIIKCATLNAAKMLGVEEEYGTIEMGKSANMIILNNNPLDDISNTLSIDVVIKKGEIQERIIK